MLASPEEPDEVEAGEGSVPPPATVTKMMMGMTAGIGVVVPEACPWWQGGEGEGMRWGRQAARGGMEGKGATERRRKRKRQPTPGTSKCGEVE